MKRQKCECGHIGSVSEDRLHLYAPGVERPFVNHEPGKCRCTNDLKLYRRDGKAVWLCSICNIFGDTPIEIH